MRNENDRERQRQKQTESSVPNLLFCCCYQVKSLYSMFKLIFISTFTTKSIKNTERDE